jgi:predicted DNA-binding transcriptional regulator AlpA
MLSDSTSVSLRVRDAAQYLGLAESTLNKLRCIGGGPEFLKLGRAVRYETHTLDRWKASRRVRNTAQADELPRRLADDISSE